MKYYYIKTKDKHMLAIAKDIETVMIFTDYTSINQISQEEFDRLKGNMEVLNLERN